jgi:hypothetical protein
MFKSISTFFKTLFFGPSEPIETKGLPTQSFEEYPLPVEEVIEEPSTPTEANTITAEVQLETTVPTVDYVLEISRPVSKQPQPTEEVATMKPKTRKSKGHNYRKGPRGPRKSADTNKK